MGAQTESLLSLSNPLVTPEQLANSSSQLDGVPAELESSIRFAGSHLTQAAGILLRLPQEIIAHAIVLFLRFYDVSAASLYLTAKTSAFPQSPRAVLNVYAFVLSCPPPAMQPLPAGATPDPESYYLTEGEYHSARTILLRTESILLRSISFVTNAVLPHRLALTYLQTLGVLPPTPSRESSALAARTLAHLNTALLSPQLLYLTHQPAALAVASIYLAARETGIRLSACEWWEVFDVDREELGFLVVGLQSCGEWIICENERWSKHKCPLTIDELEQEMKNPSSTD
ncbi:hypothetical protein MMC07_009475 [Pseudocyphellaria aurata]|nr:hypothetical protein [Pseudocyphellaria aurata]